MESEQRQPNLDIQIRCAFDEIHLGEQQIRKLLNQICEKFSLYNAEISISVVGDEEMRRINSEFLNRDTATDVISFDLTDEDESGRVFDIIVNGEKARRQASRRKHSEQAELALYLVHGMLHNLGFDDSDRRQAERMHKAEDKILTQAGYGAIYGEKSCHSS